MNSSALVLRLAGANVARRCIKPSSTPLSLFQRKYLSSSFSHFSPFLTTKRFYSSEQKKNEPTDTTNTNLNTGENKPQEIKQDQQTNQPQEQKQEGEQKIEGQETKKEGEQKIEGQEKQTGQQEQKPEGEQKQEGQQEQKQEQKQEGEQKKEGEQKEGEQKEGEQKEGEGEQKKQEELPPWFASLPLWKKLLYPSLLISFVSLITELIYQSTLRGYLPYKRAMHIIRTVDEIETAMGEIKEPRWYRFWEMLYGYQWEESGGYEGIAKFWIPIVGVTEHETGELNKKGEPVIYKTYTRGRAYAEAKKTGAGQREWEVMYLVVKSPLLGKNEKKELLGEEIEGRVNLSTGNKGEIVVVDKRVILGNEY